MKKLLFFICILIRCIPVFSYEEVVMTYKGGRPFETYMPITANDTIICSNILGEKGTWKVSLEARTIFGNIILRKGISVSNASYFRFTPRELTAWGDALIRRDDNGNPYTIGEIEFRMGNSTTRWDIRFEVWPNRPKIISASFNYDDFDYDQLEFVNPTFNFIVEAEQADKFYCACTPYYPNEYDKDLFFIEYPLKMTQLDTNIYRVSGIWTWDQKITIYSANFVGYSVNSDTLYTNDYIKDKNILDTINGFMSLIKDQEVIISIKNKKIYLPSNAREVKVYDIKGFRTLYVRDSREVDLSMLKRGLYCIVIVTKEGKIETKKISL